MAFGTNGPEKMRIDAQGYVGVGVIPESSAASDNSGIFVGGLGGLWGKTTAAAAKKTVLSNNVYDHSGGLKAIVADEGAMIELNNGTITLKTTAAATSADAVHSFNSGIIVNPNGNVNIGIGGSGGDLLMQPLAKVYLDAGGDTYIQESAGNVIDVYTGGTQRLRLNSSGASVTGTVTQSTAKTKNFTGQYDGRETNTITLGSLGFKPQVLFCIFNVGTTQHASWGMACRDSGQHALLDYDVQAAGDGYESTNTYFGRLAFGSAVFSNLAVSAWNDNEVVIQKSVNNSGSSSTCVYRIIVMG
tara:strand:- start:175 stop:1080 length:906 start_codon:yes stop_codon:yes gene_type:complete